METSSVKGGAACLPPAATPTEDAPPFGAYPDVEVVSQSQGARWPGLGLLHPTHSGGGSVAWRERNAVTQLSLTALGVSCSAEEQAARSRRPWEQGRHLAVGDALVLVAS